LVQAEYLIARSSGLSAGPALLSNVTKAIQDEVREWQSRPLESIKRYRGFGRQPTEMKNRGGTRCSIACIDSLKEAVFPNAEVQLCIVHLVRHSLNYLSWIQRLEVAADLRLVHSAPTKEEAARLLEEFALKWDATHPTVSQVWQRNWQRITPFLAYANEIRKVISYD
jgi:transposase-like protein